MEKVIKIGEKEYNMKSSAYTILAYKNEWHKDLLKDFKSLYAFYIDLGINDNENIKDVAKKDENILSALENSGDMLNTLLQLAYIMIKEADKNQVESYESFLKGIDNLFTTNSSWINEVAELGMALF